MTCIRTNGAIVCVPQVFRLPLANGRRVFMEWHSHLGPAFFRDRAGRREMAVWWCDLDITQALDWFIDRGGRA